MGLLFDIAKLKAETNAIGDSLDFDQLSAVMSSVYGDQVINEIANARDPRRTVAEQCIRYADRHGMVSHLFLDVAKRTEAADALRSRLITAVRQAFSPYADVALPIDSIVQSWIQGSPIDAASGELKLRILDAVDCVERPDVLKAMRDSALKLDQHSKAIDKLLKPEMALSPFFLESSQEHIEAIQEAVVQARALLARLSRTDPEAIEVRWPAGLETALGTYRNAVTAQDFDAIRSARNVAMHILDTMTARFSEDLLACAATLTLERVAVALREATIAARLAAAMAKIEPAILSCGIALSHRRQTQVLWNGAIDQLKALHALAPVDSAEEADGALLTVSDQWPAARTVVRTLGLLADDKPFLEEEAKAADAVGDAIAAAVQKAGVTTVVRDALAAYLDKATEKAGQSATLIEQELGKLTRLREMLRTIRAALP